MLIDGTWNHAIFARHGINTTTPLPLTSRQWWKKCPCPSRRQRPSLESEGSMLEAVVAAVAAGGETLVTWERWSSQPSTGQVTVSHRRSGPCLSAPSRSWRCLPWQIRSPLPGPQQIDGEEEPAKRIDGEKEPAVRISGKERAGDGAVEASNAVTMEGGGQCPIRPCRQGPCPIRPRRSRRRANRQCTPRPMSGSALGTEQVANLVQGACVAFHLCALRWAVEKARPNRPVGPIKRETTKKATGAAAQKASRGLRRELARAYEIQVPLTAIRRPKTTKSGDLTARNANDLKGLGWCSILIYLNVTSAVSTESSNALQESI